MDDKLSSKEKLILSKLRENIEGAPVAAFSQGRVTVDRDEMLSLLRELEDTVDAEMRSAREITDKQAKILKNAREEAEEIRYEAEKSAARIRVSRLRSGEKRTRREEELTDEKREALHKASDIYGASLIYTDEMLTEVEHLLRDSYQKIEKEYETMQAALGRKISDISSNKNELVRGLMELSDDERKQQILDISRLLSNELYHEKMKAMEEERESRGQISFKAKAGSPELTLSSEKKKRERIDPDRTARKLSDEEIVKP